jgi:hypothetical protein
LTYAIFIAIKRTHLHIDYKSSILIYSASFLSAVPILALLNFSSLNSIFNIIVSGLVFIITYLTLLPLIGAIREQDIENLTQIFRKLKIIWPLINLILTYEAKIINLKSSQK